MISSLAEKEILKYLFLQSPLIKAGFFILRDGHLEPISEAGTMLIDVQRHTPEGVEVAPDAVADEEPFQITVDGFPVAVVMRTPGDDEELARGFLLTEGFITKLSQISRIDLDQKENHALVFLADGVEFDAARLSRNLFSASSCGICGKASIEAIHQHHEALSDGFQVTAQQLLAQPVLLLEAQRNFVETGGVHAAALFDASGRLLVLREDVGRHNALDKVIGWALAEGCDLSEMVLQVSGRVSFEVMQKALAAKIAVVAAISAPSSLAVNFARESNQALVGFLRPPSFNIYAGENRIVK